MAKGLASVADLQGRINANVAGVGDLSQLLASSLFSATTQLIEHLLIKSFDATVAVVEDFIIPETYVLDDNRFLRFRLNNGLVSQTANSVSMVYGVTEADLASAPPVATEFRKIDEEKGLVYFDNLGFSDDLISIHRRISPDDRFTGYIFRITYDHGLAFTNTVDGDFYDDVPDWLQELALIKAREIYQLTIPSKDKKPASISMNFNDMLAGRIRYYPTALRPIL